MRTSALSSLLSSLLLSAAACNGAIPSGPGTSGGSSETAGETTGASNGSGPSTGSTSAGQNNTSGSGDSSSGGGSSTGTAGASTGQPGSNGSSGGTGAGISTGMGTSSGGKSSGTGGSTSGSTGGGAACNPACAGKLSCCGSTCVDLTGDSFNCGVCGKLCPAGDYCSDSACVAAECPNGGCNSGGCCNGQCCDTGQVCCLDNGPVEFFLCQDPDAGSCPIGCGGMCVSRRDAKRDIEYLDEGQLRSAEAQVLKIPLARFNYKWDGPNERRRLGFIIDDVAPSPGVIDEARGEVDLYGYTSLAVAALQEQGKEIDRLRKQVDELQKRLDRPHPPKK